MMNEPENRASISFAVLVFVSSVALFAVALAGTCESRPARAQSLDETVLVLLRAAVSEADFSRPDAAATWHVYRRRAIRNGVDVLTMARRYASGFRIAHTPRLRWVMALDTSCEQPEGWPSDLAWSAWRPKCEQIVDDAYAFLQGRLTDPCPGATQFGAPNVRADLVRASNALAEGRWALVVCRPQTANVFYREVRR